MSELVQDGVGQYHEELPKLNVDLLTQCVEWVSGQTQGDNGTPAWLQTAWAAHLEGRVIIRQNQGYVETREHYCGSAYCVCGYGLMMSENTITLGEVVQSGDQEAIAQACRALGVLPEALEYYPSYLLQEMVRPDVVGFDGNLVEPDAKYGEIDWREAGEAVFGLTPHESSYLFAGDRTVEEIVEMCDSIAQSRGLSLI